MTPLPTNIVEFKIPKKPRVKEREPEPDRRKVAVLPIKAVFDQKLTHGGLQVLAAICSFANRAGITWVSQTRLAKDLGISQQAVSKQVIQLRELGYLQTVKKGFKGERSDTIRVIFDPTIDTETAIAVTSSIEDTRPHYMKEKQQQEQDNTIDPEGLKRIQDMIRGVVKPINEPAKEYAMPKGKDTVTVAKMKQQIAAKKERKDTSNHNPQVVEEEGLHSQPSHNLEVVLNTEEHRYKEVLSKVLKVNLMNVEVLKMLVGTMQVNELETVAKQLAERYQAEGIAIPTSEMMLADDLINLSAENLLRTHGV
jgi:DNA-binding transcriptional MocR family regulator